MKFVTLNNGVKIPRLGYGVHQISQAQPEAGSRMGIWQNYEQIDPSRVGGGRPNGRNLRLWHWRDDGSRVRPLRGKAPSGIMYFRAAVTRCHRTKSLPQP